MKSKSFLLLVFFLLLLFFGFLIRSLTHKKKKTILFTNVRDETHIREWIDHHFLIGFDFIYIFDHMSEIPVSTLVDDLQNIKIDRIDHPFSENFNKITLINKAVDYAKNNNYEWMLYLDGDEFLYLRDDATIDDFLNKYGNVDQVGINWLLFGSNYLEQEPPGIRNYYNKSNRYLDRHVKSFVKPSCVEKSVNPHYYLLVDGSKTVAWDGTPFNGPFYGDGLQIDKNRCNAYVAHYFSQCYDVYKKRKIQRTRDDIPGAKWDNILPKEKFHEENNEIENMDLKKYV